MPRNETDWNKRGIGFVLSDDEEYRLAYINGRLLAELEDRIRQRRIRSVMEHTPEDGDRLIELETEIIPIQDVLGSIKSPRDLLFIVTASLRYANPDIAEEQAIELCGHLDFKTMSTMVRMLNPTPAGIAAGPGNGDADPQMGEDTRSPSTNSSSPPRLTQEETAGT